jgi:ubiquitin carboxyl-terminal hydrolase 25/28
MEDPPHDVTHVDANATATITSLGEAKTHSSPEGIDKDPVAAEAAANVNAGATPKTGATSTVVPLVSKQDIDAILDQTEIHGTDQMDVEEIMGRCLGYIRAVINTNSIKDQTSSDIIFDTFYTQSVDVKKNKGQAEVRTPNVDRWFTAYPGANGRVNLYDALAGTFDLEEISASEGPLNRFASIVKPAPIFHIFIQRSAIGIKNANPVQIPDELYLDRYTDAPEDSQLFQTRKRGWNLKRQIEEYQAVLTTDTSSSLPAPSAPLNSSGGDADLYEESNLGFDLADDDSFVVVDGESESLIQLTDDENEAVVVGGESFDEEMEDVVVGAALSQPEAPLRTPGVEELKAELAGLFTGLTTHKYRLHAVICHAGQMAAGHYWVWIFDFGAGVWRKYNDAAVMERSTAETHEVLEELSTRGEPYYLAYVREEGRDGLVQVPPRIQDEVVPAAPAPAPTVVPDDDDLLPPYGG